MRKRDSSIPPSDRATDKNMFDNNRTADNDNRSAEQVMFESRCAVPQHIKIELASIAAASSKSLCEVQTQVLDEYVKRKKFEDACLSGEIKDEQCKTVRYNPDPSK